MPNSAFRYAQNRCIVEEYATTRESRGKEDTVATFISLVNWTDQGIRNAKDTVQRYERSEELANKHGVSNEQIYWTVGPYDMVFIAQAPDAESVTAYLLEIGSIGNIRTTTLRGYNREEMGPILERVG
jgi:uncharacterized protein with GYD domain